MSSPEARVWASLVSNVVIGVLGGTLVTELTVDGRIVWATFYEAVSFWALVVAVGLVGVFSVAAINHGRHVEKFYDDPFCIALVRSQLLPELVARWRERIRNGQDGDVQKATEELREFLK